LPNSLAALRLRTKLIVQQKPRLGEKSYKDILRVLQSGEKAVKLRTQVNKFFSSEILSEVSSKSNDQHLHCIQTLQECLAQLQKWMEEMKPLMTTSSSTNLVFASPKFSGLEDELKALEEDSADQLGPIKRTNFSIDDIDQEYGEMKISLVCFMLYLIDAQETVEQTWKRMKNGEISLITASMINHVIFQDVKATENSLQAIFSEFQSVHDVFTVFFETFPPKQFASIYKNESIAELFATHIFFYLNAVGVSGAQKGEERVQHYFAGSAFVLQKEEEFSVFFKPRFAGLVAFLKMDNLHSSPGNKLEPPLSLFYEPFAKFVTAKQS
jgi:hypothetical protein